MPHSAVEDPQVGIIVETRPHGDVAVRLELGASHDPLAGHFLVIGVQQQLLERSGQFLPLGRFIEARLPAYGLRVEVRIERFVDRLDVLQPGAEFHVEAVGDHLEELAEQFPFPRGQSRVLQHFRLKGRRFDGQKVFPPIEKLQAELDRWLSKHDPDLPTEPLTQADFPE